MGRDWLRAWGAGLANAERPGSSSFSDLAFVGVAVGLFLANAFPALRLNLWQVGVAFLLLALGSPKAWLLGGFAGMGP